MGLNRIFAYLTVSRCGTFEIIENGPKYAKGKGEKRQGDGEPSDFGE